MISKEQVQHIAKLARLSLTEKEIKKFQKQLSETLDYINILKKIDIKGIEPTFQVTDLKNIFREDEVTESLSQDEALLSARSKYGGYFKTNRILEHK